MNDILKVFLSMSFSGSLIIVMLLFGKRFLKDKISRKWQYYIWLTVIIRLLLPFGTKAEAETSLLGKTYQEIGKTVTQTKGDYDYSNISTLKITETSDFSTISQPIHDIVSLLINHIWLIWLIVALIMLIRKITIYQSFSKYINSSSIPISDIEILNKFSIIAEKAGVRKPTEIYVNPLISSPILTGFFKPCIVIPSTDISEEDFRYIILHELTHYKRLDMFYKWFVQITVCLHWFNPLVYLMEREITKACEFSCDEAIIEKTGYENAQDYGKTLLNAMAAVEKYKENFDAISLNKNKQILKERLEAIMNFKKKSKAVKFSTVSLTLCVILCTIFIGVYPVSAKSFTISDYQQNFVLNEKSSKFSTQIDKYYEDGSFPLFQIAFSRLNKDEQKNWLDRIYFDGDFTFFSIAVRELSKDNELIDCYAEKAYEDEEITFFSVLTDYMSEEKLEEWLERDLSWSFQSVLCDKLNMTFEKYEWEKEWEENQIAEYKAAGVIFDGEKYYYKNQSVNIFLDIMDGKRFYTLDINPDGVVNIKVIRGKENQITGIEYMTEDEVKELLEDMYDPDDSSD